MTRTLAGQRVRAGEGLIPIAAEPYARVAARTRRKRARSRRVRVARAACCGLAPARARQNAALQAARGGNAPLPNAYGSPPARASRPRKETGSYPLGTRSYLSRARRRPIDLAPKQNLFFPLPEGGSQAQLALGRQVGRALFPHAVRRRRWGWGVAAPGQATARQSASVVAAVVAGISSGLCSTGQLRRLAGWTIALGLGFLGAGGPVRAWARVRPRKHTWRFRSSIRSLRTCL